jgi:serine/threonine-protein kinase
MSENKPPLAPGAPLGPYTLQALLGRGQDTEVYRSHSPEVKRDVALKIYHPKPGQITGAQFKNDVGAIAALKHPNIMRIFDYGVEGDLYYIVMELVEGSSLRDLLSTHPTGLAREETMRLFSQLASAVASVTISASFTVISNQIMFCWTRASALS